MKLSRFWRNVVWWPWRGLFCSCSQQFYIALLRYWQLKKNIATKAWSCFHQCFIGAKPLCASFSNTNRSAFLVMCWGSSYAAISSNSHRGDRHLASCSVNWAFVFISPNSLCFLVFFFFPAKESLNFYSRRICLNVIIRICVANELIIL